MSQVSETKAALKKLIAQGIDQAIRRLEEILSPASPLYNTYIQLKSRYSAYLSTVMLGTVSQKELDEQYAKLSHTLILLTDGIQEYDLKPETKAPSSANTPRRGELLYHIPRQMQEQQEYRCTVRVAYLKKFISKKWKAHKDDVRGSIRIAEVMAVELTGLDEMEAFRIKSLHNTVQFLDENDFTEWVFLVIPKQIGEFSLALRVSVIVVKDNREVKKDIVLEQRVIVVTEKSDPEDLPKFVKSKIKLAFLPSITEGKASNNINNQNSESHGLKSLIMTLTMVFFILCFSTISAPGDYAPDKPILEKSISRPWIQTSGDRSPVLGGENHINHNFSDTFIQIGDRN